MKVIHEEGSRPIHLWTDDIDEKALAQLRNAAKLPFVHPHGVAAMPDVHLGIGATVGSVLATHRAIIPAAVGVDIGCGMIAAKTNIKLEQLPDSLEPLLHSIERGIPLGAGGRHQGDKKIEEKYLRVAPPPLGVLEVYGKARAKAAEQLGTLGSGNHFIELCGDENHDVWLMLHSGSRGIGNQIGSYYIEQAKKLMEKFYITLPDQDLAYLPDGTREQRDYVEAVNWAQKYAFTNRIEMLAEFMRCLRHEVPSLDVKVIDEAINCHHNYVEMEHHYGKDVYLTRKGAIRARLGDLGIIPGSMGVKSYIVRGLGNPASYHSCSHGAGRKLGRRQARERFTVQDLEAQTQGVTCRKEEAFVDEIPEAYKNIDTVMANQKDLVEVVHTLKQVMCAKGK